MGTIVAALPIELLSRTFRLLTAPISVAGLDHMSPMNRGEFPWAVGLVCKRWRAAFLSDPSLWASLRLGCHTGGSDAYYDEVLHRLALYLERSREHLLDVQFYEFSTKGAWLKKAWRMLLLHSPRWQRARLWLSEGVELQAYKGKMVALQELTIRPPPYMACHDVFEVAPCLERVSFEEWKGFDSCKLPWSQLTTLDLDLFSVAASMINGELRHLLSLLININVLRIRSKPLRTWAMDVKALELPYCTPVRLSSLRSLDVPCSLVLRLLDVPALEELRIWKDVRSDLNFSEGLSSLIHRSSCKVKQLRLPDIEDAAAILSILPDVEDLRIMSFRPVVHSGILSRLSKDDCLPKLRLLTVTTFIKWDESCSIVEGLRKLLESRTQNTQWNGTIVGRVHHTRTSGFGRTRPMVVSVGAFLNHLEGRWTVRTTPIRENPNYGTP